MGTLFHIVHNWRYNSGHEHVFCVFSNRDSQQILDYIEDNEPKSLDELIEYEPEVGDESYTTCDKSRMRTFDFYEKLYHDLSIGFQKRMSGGIFRSYKALFFDAPFLYVV